MLLEAFGAWVALPAGTVIFAAAHYVRSVKRYWTFPGHVALGALLCAAFYWTGNVWLSFGVHAGGVLVLMAVQFLTTGVLSELITRTYLAASPNSSYAVRPDGSPELADEAGWRMPHG